MISVPPWDAELLATGDVRIRKVTAAPTVPLIHFAVALTRDDIQDLRALMSDARTERHPGEWRRDFVPRVWWERLPGRLAKLTAIDERGHEKSTELNADSIMALGVLLDRIEELHL